MGPMRRLRGTSASRGIVIGPAYLLQAKVVVAERRIPASERQAELQHLEAALRAADLQLEGLRGQLGDLADGQALVETHRLMLRGPELAGETRRIIADEGLAAEWALTRVLAGIHAVFAGLEDPFFRARGADFEAVGERLLRLLLGLPELRAGEGARPGAIAVGVDLSPLDPFALRKAGVVGIVCEGGGKTSHAAVVARDLGLPYVVGVKHLTGTIRPGTTLILNGTHGELVVDPDAETLQTYQRRALAEQHRADELRSGRHLPCVTLDGVAIHLGANVESLAGVSAAVASGAESIGLFRTAFLYLDRRDRPSEDEQHADAVATLRAVQGLPVTFRTLDLGSDKLPLTLDLPTGRNPALGVRSIRFSLARPEIFRTQLRALYRASASGEMRVMLPLITGVTELMQARQICDEVWSEVVQGGRPHGSHVPLGVMVETPSAAVTVDHLARHCDFLSIGTNDLIQYAFAADRENDDVSHYYQPFHPAVLRGLAFMIACADKAGARLSLCGDIAGDPTLTWILMGLGLRELSMDASSIPVVKAVVRASNLSDAQRLAALALTLDSEIAVGRLVKSTMADRLPPEISASLQDWW
jgi:phosphoenolpyruvate-protein phosphotransferase (PTS system enzyme I)